MDRRSLLVQFGCAVMSDVVLGRGLTVEISVDIEDLLARRERDVLVVLAAGIKAGKVHDIDVSIDRRMRVDDDVRAVHLVLSSEMDAAKACSRSEEHTSELQSLMR